MICPIRFIRKPEESECIREQCGFWLKAEALTDDTGAPERFSAVITGPADRHRAGKTAPVDGKCAILAIAETIAVKNE
ncbi:MAG: hypothetical protein QME74_00335 [Candidatus Edwardsbacteria bacterium]|nr:hypothetical protein [Candidatus Edwardsbacteria bacterium]